MAPPNLPTARTTNAFVHPPRYEVRIHATETLLASRDLTARIINLISQGYLDPSAYPAITDASQRFRDPSHLHSTLGGNGLVAVVYNVHSYNGTQNEGEEETKEGGNEELVACACASVWTGDMGGQNSGKEDGGYEIKAVTSLPAYRKAGLVNRCLEALTAELVRKEAIRKSLAEEGGPAGGQEGNGKLKVWVHAVEEYNGDYWWRKGWRFVRGYDMPAGHHISPNSVTGFRLIVLLKEVDVEL